LLEAVTRDSTLLEDQISAKLDHAVLGASRSPGSILDNPVLLTGIIAAVVSICVVGVVSLVTLVCWHRYRKRYYGEWIVNKNQQRIDAWSFENDAFYGSADDKYMRGGAFHFSTPMRAYANGHAINGQQVEGATGGLHQCPPTNGWVVPKEVMEMVENDRRIQ